MRAVVTVTALKTKSLNVREHHYARARRVSAERLATAAALCAVDATAFRAAPAVRVTLTRVAPRLLDSDNMVGGLKGVRDEVAKWLKKSDAPGSGVEWIYSQERGAVGVRIELETEG